MALPHLRPRPLWPHIDCRLTSPQVAFQQEVRLLYATPLLLRHLLTLTEMLLVKLLLQLLGLGPLRPLRWAAAWLTPLAPVHVPCPGKRGHRHSVTPAAAAERTHVFAKVHESAAAATPIRPRDPSSATTTNPPRRRLLLSRRDMHSPQPLKEGPNLDTLLVEPSLERTVPLTLSLAIVGHRKAYRPPSPTHTVAASRRMW